MHRVFGVAIYNTISHGFTVAWYDRPPPSDATLLAAAQMAAAAAAPPPPPGAAAAANAAAWARLIGQYSRISQAQAQAGLAAGLGAYGVICALIESYAVIIRESLKFSGREQGLVCCVIGCCAL